MEDIRIYIIYNWFIYLSIFIIGLLYLFKNKQINNKCITNILLVLITCYALFYNSDFDYYRLKYVFYYKESESVRLEPIYHEIAKICFGNYHIFRILIWGTALALFHKATKYLRLNSTVALILFGILYIKTFSYARVSLAVCCLLLCYVLFLNTRNKSKKYLLTALLFVLSINLHKTMIFLWFIVLIAHYIKPKKSNIIKAIAAFPFIAIGSNFLIRKLIPFIGYISTESQGYAETALAGENTKGFSLYYITALIPLAIPFFISLFKLLKDKNADTNINKIAMLAFFVIYAAFIFLTIDFGNVNLLCKRFINLSIPFALITITYAYSRYLNCKKITNICALMEGVMVLYYAIHIYNTIDIKDSVIF